MHTSVEDIPWFHRIDLHNGVVTPGVDHSAEKLIRLGFPSDLTGKTFLDIGAWDGFFSFEAERRGARRVLATDSFVWEGRTWGSKDGFDFAKRALGSKVEEMLIDHTDFSPERIGIWDVVLFAGVLYHVKNPMLSLEKVSSVCREMLILETETDMEFLSRPAMAFYPEKELNGDPTNWSGPNLAMLRAILKLCGFRRIEVISRTSKLRRIMASIRHVSLSRMQRDRVVLHAFR